MSQCNDIRITDSLISIAANISYDKFAFVCSIINKQLLMPI